MNRDPICRAARRGSAYLVVIGAAMLVALLGLSSLMALRIQRRVVEDAVDAAQARAYAQAAIEVGMSRIADDADWRTNYTHGVWITDQPLGEGSFTLEGRDDGDGDLADDDTDELVLTGIGVKGRARQKTQVRLVPELRGVGALEAALFAGGSLTFTGAAVQSDGLLVSNGSVTAGSSTVGGDVEASATISGSTYNGSQTAGVDERSAPAGSVFTPYSTSGASIPISSLPVVNGFRTLENVVLSPASNPYGAAQAQGIYVIDCQSASVCVRNLRIVGTLVLLNAGDNSKLTDSVHWDAAVANYPALLVDGAFSVEMSGTALSEAALGANFNPAGTAWEGQSDIDTEDSYPSRIKGLAYIGGDSQFTTSPTFEGVVVVAGAAQVSGTLSLIYSDDYLTNPPPGFLDKTLLTVAPGSWSKDVD
jgi:hypothetical protein